MNIPTVLGDVIERNARYFPGRPPSFAKSGGSLEFAARVRKFANALASGGLPQARSPSWRRTARNISGGRRG
jgi:hypothetical protein